MIPTWNDDEWNKKVFVQDHNNIIFYVIKILGLLLATHCLLRKELSSITASWMRAINPSEGNPGSASNMCSRIELLP